MSVFSFKGMTVDDFLKGEFMEGSSEACVLTCQTFRDVLTLCRMGHPETRARMMTKNDLLNREIISGHYRAMIEQ